MASSRAVRNVTLSDAERVLLDQLPGPTLSARIRGLIDRDLAHPGAYRGTVPRAQPGGRRISFELSPERLAQVERRCGGNE
ncbi:MAG: hypothetical protein H0V89_00025, partial [Deltaproteobacteria bacterium]|nr:hypothetical protein [Deltaproteobacteria bacterium]